jgi:hypothetical protein
MWNYAPREKHLGRRVIQYTDSRSQIQLCYSATSSLIHWTAAGHHGEQGSKSKNLAGIHSLPPCYDSESQPEAMEKLGQIHIKVVI